MNEMATLVFAVKYQNRKKMFSDSRNLASMLAVGSINQPMKVNDEFS